MSGWGGRDVMGMEGGVGVFVCGGGGVIVVAAFPITSILFNIIPSVFTSHFLFKHLYKKTSDTQTFL